MIIISADNFLKLIGKNYVYNGATGQYLYVGNAVIEALRSNFKLPWAEQTIDKTLLAAARRLVEQGIEDGSFYVSPFNGCIMPSDAQIKTPKLKLLTLVVTEQCNLRCTYCPYTRGDSIKHRSHRSLHMSKEVADHAVDYFLRNASDESAMGFYGGEPLLNFDLIKYVVHRLKNESPDWNTKFVLTSNLNVFSEEICQFLHDNGIFLFVSIDGPQEVHDRNRINKAGQGSFTPLIRNLYYIKDRFPDYYAQCISSISVINSHSDLDCVAKFFANADHRFVFSTFNLVNPTDHDPTANAFYKEEVPQIYAWLFQEMNALSVSGSLNDHTLLKGLIQKRINTLQKPTICDENRYIPFKSCIPGDKILVNTDGSLSICDKCESLKIGDIRSGIDFEKSKQLIADWNQLLGDLCVNCWAAGFCKACFIAAWNGEKLDKKQLTGYCATFRESILQWLDVYLPIKRKNPDFFACLEEFEANA